MSLVNILSIEAVTSLNGSSLNTGANLSNPEGMLVAFTSSTIYAGTGGGGHIYVKDVETGQFVRADVGYDGSLVTGSMPVLSPDGTKVMYYSTSASVVAGDANGVGDLFVRDLVSGTNTLVTQSESGTQANTGNSMIAQFTPDSSKVIFSSQANNLVAGDTDNLWDIFIKDLTTGVVQLISTNSSGVSSAGNYFTYAQAFQSNVPPMNIISADGNKVVFFSNSSTLAAGDTNSAFDVFMKNLSTGETTLVSQNSINVSGGFTKPIISDNGNVVGYFGGSNIYVKNLTTGVQEIASKNASGTAIAANTFSGFDLSSDGGMLLFATTESLVAADNNGRSDIYLRDIATGEIQLISVNASGVVLNHDSTNAMFSSDGRTITFETRATNHGYGDTTNTADILVYHLAGPALSGDGGDNNFAGTQNWDEYHGLGGNDTILGGYGDDSLFGDDGNDSIDGGSRNDLINGGTGNDTLLGGAGNDSIVGDAGYDSILGGDGGDTIDAGGFNDTVDGGAGNDSIFGSGGDDVLNGSAGLDSINGGTGNDTIDGGEDNDYILGHNGNDVIFGGTGNDSIYGQNDNDSISGGSGDDYITGDAGNDTITGGEGIDTMFGGAGADTFVFLGTSDSSSAGNVPRDTIADFQSGSDKLDFSAFAGTLTFLGMGSFFTGAGNEVIAVQSSGPGVAHTIVAVDVDGDQNADIMINLSGNVNLVEGDFIL